MKLPDVAWPAARSAALRAFCRRQNAPEERFSNIFWSQHEPRMKLDGNIKQVRTGNPDSCSQLTESSLLSPINIDAKSRQVLSYCRDKIQDLGPEEVCN